MADSTILTAEAARNLLRYDQDTGDLFWKERTQDQFDSSRPGISKWWNGRYAGNLAFTAKTCGYRSGKLKGKLRLAHRVIWLMQTGSDPSGQIDHINGDKLDNRFCNLREVTQAENLRNMKMSALNTSGHTGVYRNRRGDKWVAQLFYDGKTLCLGTFDEIEDAAAARERAQLEYGFHENHGKRR